MFISVILVNSITGSLPYTPPHEVHTCAAWLNMSNCCKSGFVPPNYPERATCKGACNHTQCCGKCRKDIYCSNQGSVNATNGTCVCECDSGYVGGDCSFHVSRQAATETKLKVPLCSEPKQALEWYVGMWWCTHAGATGLCAAMPLSPGSLRVDLVTHDNETSCVAGCRGSLTGCRAVAWIGGAPFGVKNCVYYSGTAEIRSSPGPSGARCYLMQIYPHRDRTNNGSPKCAWVDKSGSSVCIRYKYRHQSTRWELRSLDHLRMRTDTKYHLVFASQCEHRLKVGSRCCNQEQTRCASFCTTLRQIYSHTYGEASHACQLRGLTMCSLAMLKKKSYRGGCVGSGCGYEETAIYVRNPPACV